MFFSFASRSKDTAINIWQLHGTRTPSSDSPLVFAHLNNSKQGDLTSLDWSPDGRLLAAGSYDTYLRICDASGQLYFAESMQKVVTSVSAEIFCTEFPGWRRDLSSPRGFLHLVNIYSLLASTAQSVRGIFQRRLFINSIARMKVSRDFFLGSYHSHVVRLLS